MVSDHVGHQALLTGNVLAGYNRSLMYRGVLVQYSLNFSHLNAVTTNFHLVVSAPQKGDLTIRQEAGQVTRLVQPCSRLRVERVRDEALSGMVWAIEVAFGQSNSPNIKLTWLANRNLPQVLVQDIDLCVCDGATNRWWPIRILRRRHMSEGSSDRRLGRPVIVV